jgi:hypothetical protein
MLDIILGVTLGTTLIGAIGAIVWLVYRGDKRVDQVLNASDVVSSTREEMAKLTLESERLRFELRMTKRTLDHERALMKSLEEYVATHAIETDPNADLDPDDVAGRLLRVVQRQRQVEDDVTVPGVPTAGDTIPAELITELR